MGPKKGRIIIFHASDLAQIKKLRKDNHVHKLIYVWTNICNNVKVVHAGTAIPKNLIYLAVQEFQILLGVISKID